MPPVHILSVLLPNFFFSIIAEATINIECAEEYASAIPGPSQEEKSVVAVEPQQTRVGHIPTTSEEEEEKEEVGSSIKKKISLKRKKLRGEAKLDDTHKALLIDIFSGAYSLSTSS